MADKPLDKSSPTAAPQRLMDAQAVEQLFLRFAAIWGHRWTSLFQSPQLLTVAKAEWGADLGGYGVGLVGRAIARAKSDYQEFPPTLPQFTGLCRTILRDEMEAEEKLRAAMRKPQVVDSVAQERSRKMAKDHLDALIRKFNWSTTREANK